jgi:hypothetical protein
MSQDHHTNKNSPSESKSEREILELRIDQKLTDAKEALRNANQTELERIAREKHEPKFKRLLGTSGVVIAILIAGNLWQWFGITERIQKEAGRIIDQKLIDPQLTATLDETLSRKAIPFIAAQVHPVETNVAVLKANVEKQKALFAAMTLDVSNKQVQLTSEQMAIREQLHPLSGQIISLQSSVDVAQEQAKKLQDEQKLMALLNRGETFDREAIQELQTIAQGTNETAPLAKAMFNKVQRTLILDRANMTYLTLIESGGDKQYAGPFTSDEFASDLVLDSLALDGTINAMGKQPLFVPKLVEFAHQSKDLWTINRIAKSLNDMAGVNFYPWDLQPLDKWWAQNSLSYTNWPFNQYQKALTAFRACKYNIALTNFESVLVIDRAADKSRALAVACAIEIGDMVKAQQLNTNYALKGERWEQWANGKMMLATNAIQQGTEKFASLAKKYPTFPVGAWIGEGNHVLRKIDWALYSKLMQTPSNSIPSNTDGVK